MHCEGEPIMSQKNKNIIKIFLIAISLSILSGCTNAKQVSFQDYSIESIESIEFISEQFKKAIDKYEDIRLIQNLFKKIKVEKSLEIPDADITGWKYTFKTIDKNKNLIDEIIFYERYLYYNNKFYSYSYSDRDLFNRLKELYDRLDYEEIVEEQIEYEIEMYKNKRKSLPLEKALEGYWLLDDYGHVYFTQDNLCQGDYTFKYKVKEVGVDYIYISVFKDSKMFSNNNMLFDLYLEIDDTKNNIRLKKVVNQLWGSPLVYENNAVYINQDNYILGSFKSDYFH